MEYPESLVGASPFFSPYPPLLPTSFPPPLEVGPILRIGSLEECLIFASGSGRSPAAKRFLVHFKHYFHRKPIEKQILNSNIGGLIYNSTYRVLHNNVRANLRREKTKFLAKEIPCTDN